MIHSSDTLLHWLAFALSKRAPARIPRSGEDAETVDCFSVRVTFGEQEYLLEAINKGDVECLRWDGQKYRPARALSIYEVWLAKPDIRHFYGVWDLSWDSWDEFVFDQVTRWIYFKVAASKLKIRLREYYVSKRKMITAERITVLNAVFMAQKRGNDFSSGVSINQIVRALHGDDYYFHPAWEFYQREIELISKGLVGTKDLSVSGLDYSITGSHSRAERRE
jgi:hypothetical protein